jgi:hypothetical protein
MRGIAAFLVVCAGGCNAIFGLEPTHLHGDAEVDAGVDAAACAGSDAHDEDGDGQPDACDLCPQVFDLGVDGDGDGVGDACDPGIEQDAWFEFEDLEPANGTWFEIVGVWFNDTLGLRMTDATASGLAYESTALPANEIVDLGVTVAGVLAGDHAIALTVDGTFTGQRPTGYRCQLHTDAVGATTLELFLDTAQASTPLSTAPITTPFAPGHAVRIRARNDHGAIWCELFSDDGNAAISADETTFAGGQAGVSSNGAAYVVDYLAVAAQAR